MEHLCLGQWSGTFMTNDMRVMSIRNKKETELLIKEFYFYLWIHDNIIRKINKIFNEKIFIIFFFVEINILNK